MADEPIGIIAPLEAAVPLIIAVALAAEKYPQLEPIYELWMRVLIRSGATAGLSPDEMIAAATALELQYSPRVDPKTVRNN